MCLLFGGGVISLETLYEVNVKNRIPIIVIRGSGRVAGILESCDGKKKKLLVTNAAIHYHA